MRASCLLLCALASIGQLKQTAVTAHELYICVYHLKMAFKNVTHSFASGAVLPPKPGCESPCKLDGVDCGMWMLGRDLCRLLACIRHHIHCTSCRVQVISVVFGTRFVARQTCVSQPCDLKA
jgi:hypothetical protein